MAVPRVKKGMQVFLGVIKYYRQFVQNIAVDGAVLYKLKEDDFLSEANLVGPRSSFAIIQ